jgi:hypothetical protein
LIIFAIDKVLGQSVAINNGEKERRSASHFSEAITICSRKTRNLANPAKKEALQLASGLQAHFAFESFFLYSSL